LEKYKPDMGLSKRQVPVEFTQYRYSEVPL